MADINPNLAAFAAAANPQGGAAPASGMSSDLMQQLMSGGYDPASVSGIGDPSTPVQQTQLQPGKPSQRASLNVPLPGPPPQGPPPTPNAQVPQGPPTTPDAQVPQGPPPTPNAPQGPAAPPPPQRDPLISQMIGDPSRVIQPVAAAGRNGDSTLAHVAPGEQMVPSELMAAHPELRAAIGRAFAAHGGDRRTHQVGHPAAALSGRINPDTGLQEAFGLDWRSLLPMAAGMAGSMFLGPEVLAPMMGLEGATGLAGAVPGIIGGTLGGFAGSEVANPGAGILHNLGSSALSAGIGGAVGSMFPNVGAGANAAAGSGANAAAGTAVGNPLPTDWGTAAANNIWAANPSAGTQFAPAAATAAAPGSGLNGIMNTLMPKGILGTGAQLAGGMVGGMLGDELFPAKNANQTTTDTGGSANPQLSDDVKRRIAELVNRQRNPMPSNDYLQTYGASAQTPAGYPFFRYA